MQMWLGVQVISHVSFMALPTYCMYRYSRDYDSNGKRKVRPLHDRDICDRAVDEIVYDIGLATAVLSLAFALSWNIAGHVWLNQSSCNDMISGAAVISLTVIWFQLVVVLVLLTTVMTVIACSEGSCTHFTCMRDAVYTFCCLWMWPDSSERQRTISQIRRESTPYQPKFLMPAYNTLRVWGVYITDPMQSENFLTERELNEPSVQSITEEIRQAQQRPKPQVAPTELSMISMNPFEANPFEVNPFEVNLQFDDESSFSSRVRDAQDLPNVVSSHLRLSP
jgi:hypothetical protein